MVDVGETELELETLLKASAYILGTSGSSIVYKAVLEDGTALAVRRIGESSVERLKDFEGQVRGITKLKHPNLVEVRAFYWGEDEKLHISDYVSNVSLAFSASKWNFVVADEDEDGGGEEGDGKAVEGRDGAEWNMAVVREEEGEDEVEGGGGDDVERKGCEEEEEGRKFGGNTGRCP